VGQKGQRCPHQHRRDKHEQKSHKTELKVRHLRGEAAYPPEERQRANAIDRYGKLYGGKNPENRNLAPLG
jgi:hypothetical protein